MVITNRAAFEQFKPGSTYDLVFTENTSSRPRPDIQRSPLDQSGLRRYTRVSSPGVTSLRFSMRLFCDVDNHPRSKNIEVEFYSLFDRESTPDSQLKKKSCRRAEGRKTARGDIDPAAISDVRLGGSTYSVKTRS